MYNHYTDAQEKNKNSNKAITVPASPFKALVNVFPTIYSDKDWTMIKSRNKTQTTFK